MKNTVLIVGAGPTGLVLALWLTKQGIPVRIIDKNAEPVVSSRALGIQARTLELYQQMDLADEIIAAGHPTLQVNLWANGQKRGFLQLVKQGEKLTPYPFLLIYPQDQHERLLIRRLEELGVVVERDTELIAFSDYPDHVNAQIIGPHGKENYHVRYVAACDGGKSLIRHQLGLNFPGGTYSQIFYVADVVAKGDAMDGGAHISLDQHDLAFLLSYGKPNQARLIGIVREDRIESLETLTFDDIRHTAIQDLGLSIEKVNWFSTYRVHHRIVPDYRVGRIFLVGDAAHLHSPAGAQGMNTGIGDAINLAWKLAAVIKNQAAEQLLDSYQIERRAFAEKLVKNTDRLFSLITAQGYLFSQIRTKVVPYILPKIYKNPQLSQFVFRLISQLSICYRRSPLSQGTDGQLCAGDRLPWVEQPQGNNFESLKQMLWQIHVYGTVQPQLKMWCKMNNISLYSFAWDEVCEQAGLSKDAVYLLRPDTYIALIDPHADTQTLQQYFNQRHINCSMPI